MTSGRSEVTVAARTVIVMGLDVPHAAVPKPNTVSGTSVKPATVRAIPLTVPL